MQVAIELGNTGKHPGPGLVGSSIYAYRPSCCRGGEPVGSGGFGRAGGTQTPELGKEEDGRKAQGEEEFQGSAPGGAVSMASSGEADVKADFEIPLRNPDPATSART